MRNKTQPGGFTRLLRQGVFAILLQARGRLCSANPSGELCTLASVSSTER
jgi:hypothetical protein